MALTYSDMAYQIAQMLQDVSGDVWPVAELDVHITQGVAEASHYGPRQTKETVSTVASSYDLTLSAEHKRHLLWVERVEYKVDQDPLSFRNFERWGDAVTMQLDSAPAAVANARLYLAKRHILMKTVGTTDLAGAIKTLAAIGATSLVLKSLGVGRINEDTQLAVAGDSTVYTVTAESLISANEATVSITPALVAAASVDAVVTLSLPTSTVDLELEGPLIRLVAARAAISKSLKLYIQTHSALTRLTSALTAIGKIDAEVVQAIADLDTGRAKIDEIPIGGGAAQYSQYAQVSLANARGYLEEAAGYFRQATADAGVGSSGRQLDTWGKETLALVLRDLQHLRATRVTPMYARS